MFSILQPEADELVETGNRGGASAGTCELDVANIFADELKAVENGCGGNDRRAVLVVVKNRNLHALAQRALDVEAFRRLDVLEVDAAERRLQTGDDVNKFVRDRSR